MLPVTLILPTLHVHVQIIFGTGDTLKAVTLTANEAFVRAAAHQVMPYDIYYDHAYQN